MPEGDVPETGAVEVHTLACECEESRDWREIRGLCDKMLGEYVKVDFFFILAYPKTVISNLLEEKLSHWIFRWP